MTLFSSHPRHRSFPPPLIFQVKSDVRRMKGIPALVSMLDNPNKEVSLLFLSMDYCKSFTFREVCYDWTWWGTSGV